MKKIIDAVEKNKDLILNAERYIWENPETGFFEYKTNAYMIDAFEKLGYKVNKPDDITGFYTTIDTGKVGPTILLFAELDALICASHPESDKETGAAHVCGHNAQCATILGVAAALTDKEILDELCGKIKICLVPAEEGIEIGKRKELLKQGVITFASGKPEFIKRGYFSDVDIAFMVHAKSSDDGKKFYLGKGSNGVLRKSTTFKGVAAHAGSAPDKGINALNVAATAINVINSLRETFREEDHVRVHSIITKGGDVVNAVPDKVVMESYVRASSVKALKETNQKVNRAITAVAAAFGANVKIEDMPGSEAMKDDDNFNKLAKETLIELCGEEQIGQEGWLASSTDMGDASTLWPTIHAYACGTVGTLHSKDFFVKDVQNLCFECAEFQLMLIKKLLENGAKRAQYIIDNYHPVFANVEEYVEHKLTMKMEKETVLYNTDGTINLNF